jgi:hypothetical protein
MKGYKVRPIPNISSYLGNSCWDTVGVAQSSQDVGKILQQGLLASPQFTAEDFTF